MQDWHGFLHSNKTDQNEPKHHYWVQKSALGGFVSFWHQSEVRFGSGPNRCLKCNIGMVFCTATKLTKTNQNITIGSKKWIGCVRFVSGPNRLFVSVPARIGALNATLAWFFAQ